MSSSVSGSVIRLATGAPLACETDVLVVPVFDGEPAGTALPWLDQCTGGEVGRGLASGEIRGRLYETFVTPVTGGGKAGRIAVIGAGKAADFDLELVDSRTLDGRTQELTYRPTLH